MRPKTRLDGERGLGEIMQVLSTGASASRSKGVVPTGVEFACVRHHEDACVMKLETSRCLEETYADVILTLSLYTLRRTLAFDINGFPLMVFVDPEVVGYTTREKETELIPGKDTCGNCYVLGREIQARPNLSQGWYRSGG
ncbi:hypothetical protein HZH68_006521 [Vespula germanica]|uniref:Ig-like domain-containing protein n=1 Tax=Vespula germanica TaxID=30212 RepID=A0A834NC25_VESGE|nr:hypothetical protein HZH68_006521 [Vespula germanica]